MKQKEKIFIKNEKNEEIEYSILATFSIKNKNYVLYTDYSKDTANNLKIFSAIYDENWNLKPVTEKEEIDIIDNYIEELEIDLKEGIKFI